MSPNETPHATLRERGQVTLPAAVREALGLDVGDEVVFRVGPNGVTLSAAALVPKSQAWFWTPEWQAGEREVSEDIANGRTVKHKDADELFDHLDRV